MSFAANTSDNYSHNRDNTEGYHRWMSALPNSAAKLRAYHIFEVGILRILIRCRECRITLFGIKFCGEKHKFYAGPCRCNSVLLPCILHRPDRYLRVASKLMGRDALLQKLKNTEALAPTKNRCGIMAHCYKGARTLQSESYVQCHTWMVIIFAITFTCIAFLLINV